MVACEHVMKRKRNISELCLLIVVFSCEGSEMATHSAHYSSIGLHVRLWCNMYSHRSICTDTCHREKAYW